MLTEIISYMGYELTKNDIDNVSIDDTFSHIFNARFKCHNTSLNTSSSEEKYFNLRIKNKTYPSCYQYNVLVMLAKRLINEEKKPLI